MRVYLGIKYQVSRVTLTSFRHWGNFNPPPTPQNGPLKSAHSLGLKIISVKVKFHRTE